MIQDQDFLSEEFLELDGLRCGTSWQDEILENQPAKEKTCTCKDIRK